MKKSIRLQKHIADCGIASRRNAEKLILSGNVEVNGRIVTQLGTKVDPAIDKIVVNGKLLKREEQKIYIKLNKPCGVVSSCRRFDEKTIMDLVNDIPYRLYPVGRLDKESEGLILLTNDGELAYRLMHPRYAHEKEYEVNVEFQISDHELERLAHGVLIEGKRTLMAKIKRLTSRKFRIVLREGKKRQIRDMVRVVNNRVVSLKRIRIKNIKLGLLPPGKYEHLSPSEIRQLVT